MYNFTEFLLNITQCSFMVMRETQGGMGWGVIIRNHQPKPAKDDQVTTFWRQFMNPSTVQFSSSCLLHFTNKDHGCTYQVPRTLGQEPGRSTTLLLLEKITEPKLKLGDYEGQTGLFPGYKDTLFEAVILAVGGTNNLFNTILIFYCPRHIFCVFCVCVYINFHFPWYCADRLKEWPTSIWGD